MTVQMLKLSLLLEHKDTCNFILINFYNWQLFIKNSFSVEINSKDLYLFFKLNKNAKKKHQFIVW